MPLLLLILWPILEIWVFIQVVNAIGLGYALLLQLAAMILGVGLLWRQGMQALMAGRAQMTGGRLSLAGILTGVSTAFAGALLVLPGFVSDAIALLLLIPQVRQGLQTKSASAYADRTPYAKHFQSGPSQDSQPAAGPNADVIEGDYERMDGGSHDGNPHDSDWRA